MVETMARAREVSFFMTAALYLLPNSPRYPRRLPISRVMHYLLKGMALGAFLGLAGVQCRAVEPDFLPLSVA